MTEVQILGLYWLAFWTLFIIIGLKIGGRNKMSKKEQAAKKAHERYIAVQKQRIQAVEEAEAIRVNPYVEGTLRYDLWEKNG